MGRSLIFLSRSNIISFFFLDSFGKFQHESYVGMWGHYGSRVMGIYSRPFSGALSLIIDLV